MIIKVYRYIQTLTAKIQLEYFESAKDDCNKSLELDDSYQKIYLRQTIKV